MLVEGKEIMCVRRSYEGFSGGSVVRNPPANAGHMDCILGPGRFHIPTETKPMHHGY